MTANRESMSLIVASRNLEAIEESGADNRLETIGLQMEQAAGKSF